MGIGIVGLVAARRANKQHRQKGHQYITHGFNYKYVRRELEGDTRVHTTRTTLHEWPLQLFFVQFVCTLHFCV